MGIFGGIWRATGERRRWRVLLATALVASGVAVVGSGAQVSAGHDPCLKPRILTAHANQGLPHGPNDPPLVRGREILVKAHVALESCAPTSAQAQITEGTVTVVRTDTNTTVGAPVPLGIPTQPFTYRGDTPLVNSLADPRLVVPAATLAALPGDVRVPLRFDVVLNYTSAAPNGAADAGTVSTSVSSVLEKSTDEARILVVPVGAPGTFGPAAAAAVGSTMAALARLLPVRAGVADLADAASPAGVKFHLDETVLSIPPNAGAKWCLTSDLFTAMADDLDALLVQWNAANAPALHADRVLGVGAAEHWEPTSTPGCAEGYAGINTTHAFARMHLAAAPVVAQELLHTWALAETNSYHSTPRADLAPYENRGYDTHTYGYIPQPKSAMLYQLGINNENSLLQLNDWGGTLCVFGAHEYPGNAKSRPSWCPDGYTGSNLGGTEITAAGGTYIVVSGSTDDVTAEATSFLTTDSDHPGVQRSPSSDPTYRFVSVGPNGERSPPFNFSASDVLSNHEGDSHETAHQHCPGSETSCKSFSFTVPVDPSITAFELLKGDVVLLRREVDARAPSIDGVSVTNDGTPTAIPLVSGAADPDIADDGTRLAYAKDGCIQVADLVPADDGTPKAEPVGGAACDQALSPRPYGQPELDPAAARVAFTNAAGHLFVSTVDGSGVGTPRRINVCLAAGDTGGCATSAIGDAVVLGDVRNPSWSLPIETDSETNSAAQYLAFDIPDGIGRSVFFLDADKPVSVNGEEFYPAKRVVQDAVDPSWSNDADRATMLLFTRPGSTSHVRIVDVVAGAVDLFDRSTPAVDGAREPAWADRFVAVTVDRTDGPWVGIADFAAGNVRPGASPKIAGRDPSMSSTFTPDASAPVDMDQRVVFEREDGVYLLGLAGSRKIVVTGNDDNAGLVRVSLFIVCGVAEHERDHKRARYVEPIEVEIPATVVGERFSVERDFDPLAFGCGDHADEYVSIGARANDTFLDSGIHVSAPVRRPLQPPKAYIVHPRAGDRVDDVRVTVLGGVVDPRAGSVPDENFSWRLLRKGVVVAETSGRRSSFPTPVRQGRYQVELTVVDSAGKTGSATTEFVVDGWGPVTIFDPNSISLPNDTTSPSVVTVTLDFAGIADPRGVDFKSLRLEYAERRDGASWAPFPADDARYKPLDGPRYQGSALILKFSKAELAKFLQNTPVDPPLYGDVIRIAVSGRADDGSVLRPFVEFDPANPCVYLQSSGGNKC